MGRVSWRLRRPAATLRCDSRCGPDVRPGGRPGTAALARRSDSMADLRDDPGHEPADSGRGQQPARVVGRSGLRFAREIPAVCLTPDRAPGRTKEVPASYPSRVGYAAAVPGGAVRYAGHG